MSQITTAGVKPTRTVMRTIQRLLAKWIARESSGPKEAQYSVHLEQEGTQRTNCRVRIQIGAREWDGQADGRSIQEALLNTLSHLHVARMQPAVARA